MKRKIYLILSVCIAAVFLLTSYDGDNMDHSSGAPAGYTGSPGDGQQCQTGCHGGSVQTVTGWITSNIPTAGYTPGSTYTITVSVTGSGNHGFEVSPQNTSGTLLGSLIAGSGNKLVGSGKYVTHSSTQSGNPQTWNFQWVAPATGTGTVTFYGAFCITKSQTRLSTMVVPEVIPFVVNATAVPSSLLVGSTSQLDMSASGGSGIYTYSWTSIPPGYTSTLKNPIVTPTSSIQYIGHVSDGTLSTSDTVPVTVIPNNLAVNATANPASINAGQSSQLSSNASGGSGTYSYSWTSNPAGFFSTLANPVVYPTATTQYYVQVNDGYQQKTDTTQVDVGASTLTVNATAIPGSICIGSTSQLNASASGGSNNYNYSWTSIPIGFTSNIQNPVVSPTVTTKYIAHVNDGAYTVTDTVDVAVTPVPIVNAGNDTIYCSTITSIPLNATATNYTTVLWTTSGTGTFSNSTSLITNYFPTAGDKATGFVNLYLTVGPQLPCTNTVSDARHIQFDPCNGIQEGNEISIFIQPNPSNGIFNLIISGKKNDDATIRIFDINAKLKFAEKLNLGSGSVNKPIDLTTSPKGIYLLKYETDGNMITRKVIIQ